MRLAKQRSCAPRRRYVNVICGARKPHQIEADAGDGVKLTEQEVATVRERLAPLKREFA